MNNRPFRWVERDDGVQTLIADDISKCGWVARKFGTPFGEGWKWEAFIGCSPNGYSDSAEGTSESLGDAQRSVLDFCGISYE
jgi:hypothetical protein